MKSAKFVDAWNVCTLVIIVRNEVVELDGGELWLRHTQTDADLPQVQCHPQGGLSLEPGEHFV